MKRLSKSSNSIQKKLIKPSKSIQKNGENVQIYTAEALGQIY